MSKSIETNSSEIDDLKINIGASQTKLPDFLNVDIVPWADIQLDLGKDCLPFPDNSASVIFSYHTIEHVDNYLHCLSEIHRVLKDRGIFFLGVPYVTSTKYNLVNPYHKHHFSEDSFRFFDPEDLKGSASEPNPIYFKKVFHRFEYFKNFESWPEWVLSPMRKHLFNVVLQIEFGLVAIKSLDTPFVVTSEMKNQFQSEFQRILSLRVPNGPNLQQAERPILPS